MKQFTLRMNKAYQRPIVELKTWYGFEALLDTGAFFPIWTASEKILTKIGGTIEKRNDLNEVPFQLILSATMFDNLIYEIDCKNHNLNVTIPSDESAVRNLRIKDTEGRLYVLFN